MLGYDVRKYQLGAFVIGARSPASQRRALHRWGQYITPSSMGITAAALPIVWVAVGGRNDLTTTLVGTLLVLAGFQAITIYGSQYALVVMGALLVADGPSGPARARHGLGEAAARLRRLRDAPHEEAARMMAILETRQLNKRFRRPAGHQRRQIRPGAGRAALPHRPERRRQEHASSACSSANIRPSERPDPLRRAGHHGAASP